MLVHATRASAPFILNVAREAAAAEAKAAVHAPPPEMEAVRAKEAEAIRRLPVKKVVPGTGVLRQRVPPVR